MGIGDESFISFYFLYSRSILRDVEMNKKKTIKEEGGQDKAASVLEIIWWVDRISIFKWEKKEPSNWIYRRF